MTITRLPANLFIVASTCLVACSDRSPSRSDDQRDPAPVVPPTPVAYDPAPAPNAAPPQTPQGPPPRGGKPNIMFIMGDDIGWMQPSIYHRGLMVGETPNIDR